MPSNISQFTKKNCAMMVMIGFSLNFIPSILIPLFVEESPVFIVSLSIFLLLIGVPLAGIGIFYTIKNFLDECRQ